MDHEFWEDENELPYLVYETRDEKRSKPSRSRKQDSNEKKLDKILSSLYISDSQRRILKGKLIEFFNAKDCVNLTVEDGFGGCTFIFTRQNEYIKTRNEFEYVPGIAERRIFNDCYSYHDYDNLVNNQRFKDMIKRTGFEFIDCRGGYVTDYSGKDDEFTMKDEIYLRVLLNAGSNVRIYELDLDRMELSEKYYTYSFSDLGLE